MSSLALHLQANYVLDHNIPSPEDYVHLRTVAKLTPPPASPSMITRALSSSLPIVVIRSKPQDGPIVAMGRLIGDGGLVIQVADICVHPDHQRQGLGATVMRALTDWVDEHAPSAYVSLIADPGPAKELYERYGFVETEGRGMKRSTGGR